MRVFSVHFTDELYPANTGGSVYDGTQQVLYWADVASEVAFVVPSPRSYVPSTLRRTSDITNGRHGNLVVIL